MAIETAVPPASRAVLDAVEKIRSHIPHWERTLTSVTTELGDPTPDSRTLVRMLEGGTHPSPSELARELQDAAPAGTTAADVVGIHAELLQQRLVEADQWWRRALEDVTGTHETRVPTDVEQARSALGAAMLHCLFLSFADEVRRGHVAESHGIDAYCAGWGVNAGEIDALWSWLRQDPLEFDGAPLPIVLDTVNRAAYRKSTNLPFVVFTALTPLWSAVCVFAVVAGIFELLHVAGITTWPQHWVWKLLVLVLFVWLGALAHVGAKAIDVNYADPMPVYDAGYIWDWLSLRWIAIVKMHVPVAVVAASLWAASNYPSSIKNVAAAIVAGYSADSFLRSISSRLGRSDRDTGGRADGGRSAKP